MSGKIKKILKIAIITIAAIVLAVDTFLVILISAHIHEKEKYIYIDPDSVTWESYPEASASSDVNDSTDSELTITSVS